MNRRFFLMAGAGFALLPSGAQAGKVEDFFVRELRAQGYTDFKLSRTWLGRLRIIAISPKYRREIIVNPRTGEILRDVWRRVDTGDSREDLFEQNDNSDSSSDDMGASSSGSGSGGGSSDSDDSGHDGDSDKHDKHDDNGSDDKDHGSDDHG